jgi:hypothetical protein
LFSIKDDDEDEDEIKGNVLKFKFIVFEETNFDNNNNNQDLSFRSC